MRLSAIVPSAGKSLRMKASGEKPYLLLGGKPVLVHVLMALERSTDIRNIILLVRRSRIALAKKLVRAYGIRKVAGIYSGGASRFDSVWQGLKRLPPETDYVLVHDGARPLVDEALIRRVTNGARRYGAAVPVLPVSFTVKLGKRGFVRKTLVRKELFEVQTPQVFRRALLVESYRRAKKERLSVTDCASVVERLGGKVRLVPGDPRNIKITTREQLALAEILAKRKEVCPCAWE
ncbi:MAG: 2-C-methyl-D-erythritol 4-phosphate cytidylyltransferase [Candidatus Omnitrophota bacterium]